MGTPVVQGLKFILLAN